MAGTTGSMGGAAGYFQLGQALTSGYFNRQAGKLQSRSIAFQNGANTRQMAVQNSNAQSGYIVARSQANLARAQAAAENGMRDASNLINQSNASLDNWARSVANNRALEGGGEAYNTAVTNQLRQREEDVGTGIESRLAAAEQRGAYAAATALAGVGGSSVDQVTQAMELRSQRRDFYQQRASGYADYDAMQQIIGIIPQAASGMDMRVTQANRDFGLSTGPADPLPPVAGVSFNQQVPTQWGNSGTDALTWFMNSDNDAASRQIMDRVSSWFSQPTSGAEVPMFNALP